MRQKRDMCNWIFQFEDPLIPEERRKRPSLRELFTATNAILTPEGSCCLLMRGEVAFASPDLKVLLQRGDFD
jgi:hypothetical protein